MPEQKLSFFGQPGTTISIKLSHWFTGTTRWLYIVKSQPLFTSQLENSLQPEEPFFSRAGSLGSLACVQIASHADVLRGSHAFLPRTGDEPLRTSAWEASIQTSLNSFVVQRKLKRFSV